MQHLLNNGGRRLAATLSTGWLLFCKYIHFTSTLYQLCAVLPSVCDIKRALRDGAQQGRLLSPFLIHLHIHSQTYCIFQMCPEDTDLPEVTTSPSKDALTWCDFLKIIKKKELGELGKVKE